MLFFLVNEQIYLKGESLAFLGLLTTCLRKTTLDFFVDLFCGNKSSSQKKRKRCFTKLKRNVSNL